MKSTDRQRLNKWCDRHGNYVDVKYQEMGCPECMEEHNPFESKSAGEPEGASSFAPTSGDDPADALYEDCREDAEAEAFPSDEDLC